MGIGARWRPEFKAPFDDSTKTKQEATVYAIPHTDAKVYKAFQYLRKTENVKLLKGLGATGEALTVATSWSNDTLGSLQPKFPIYNKVEDAPYVEYVLENLCDATFTDSSKECKEGDARWQATQTETAKWRKVCRYESFWGKDCLDEIVLRNVIKQQKDKKISYFCMLKQ